METIEVEETEDVVIDENTTRPGQRGGPQEVPKYRGMEGFARLIL